MILELGSKMIALCFRDVNQAAECVWGEKRLL